MNLSEHESEGVWEVRCVLCEQVTEIRGSISDAARQVVEHLSVCDGRVG